MAVEGYGPDPWKIHSAQDPNLDLMAMGFDGDGSIFRYAQTRDPSLVKVEPGRELATFVVRRLPYSVMHDVVMTQESVFKRASAAFRYAVQAIDNLTDMEGVYHASFRPADTVMTGAGVTRQIWSLDQMGLIPPAYIEEIGGLAFQRSFLPRNERRYWQVPLSCLAALADESVRLAGERKMALTKSLHTKLAELLANASGAPTDAPATGAPTEQPDLSGTQKSASGTDDTTTSESTETESSNS